MNRLVCFLIVLFSTQCLLSSAQLKMSTYSEVSLLTIGPGDQLNDAFGHSGIRIKDPMFNLDIVFDYGRYDFSAEGFYINFVKGKLDYEIGWTNFERFISYYSAQKRRVTSQVIELDLDEKQRLFELLQQKIQPQNKTYPYDFFYNNCATKIKDDIIEVSKNPLILVQPEGFSLMTFRELIRTHVPSNSWGGFGIDLALGSVIDQQASLEEHLFLPSYLNLILGLSKFEVSDKNVVKETRVLSSLQNPYPNNFWSSPLFVFGILSIISLILTVLNYKSGRRSKILDLLIFFTTGFVGLILTLLWFGTDHTATAYNYNMLWACVFNLMFIPTLLNNKAHIRFVGYLKFTVLLLFLMLLHWLTGVQSFNVAVLPLWIALMTRYFYLIHWCNNNLKSA